MRSQKRDYVSNLICQYLHIQNTTRVEITAREIVDYYQLSTTYCYSVSALLKRVFDNGIRDPRYGFYVVKTRDVKKYRQPRHYTIELISPLRKQTEAQTRS